MKYHIYKFHFSTALHIGNGNLTDGESMVCADTFFSGLCHEAVKYGGQACIDSLVQDAKSGKLLFSDMLPFISDELYIPKPLNPVKTEQEGDSVQKKKFKKLKFIPVQKIDAYLAGNLDPEDEISKFKSLGSFDMRTMSSSLDPEKSLTGDMLPFSVGTYKFGANNGLYIIAAFADSETEKQFDLLLTNLSYSGIGGKRSAGFGRYTFEKMPVPDVMLLKLKNAGSNVITLSTSMAKPEELEGIISDANYLLIKRSGFVSSATYADSFRRKKDFYAFKAGSCFKKTFTGDVFDVSDGGSHPVYRYAKPLFMEV